MLLTNDPLVLIESVIVVLVFFWILGLGACRYPLLIEFDRFICCFFYLLVLVFSGFWVEGPVEIPF